tara:strand:+ start:4637 stop:6229 length:1593 start_codon:yes stop_codon:yes gene_type:complete
MKKIITNHKILLLVLLSFFSFSINYYYGNIGVFPIDTFAFFDTAYNILLDRHPFKDIWVTTGPLVDYLQALFFIVFGLKWSSHLIHASIINLLVAVSFYLVLNRHGLNAFLSFFYSISLSILCYTVSGTPFAYVHSYAISLISILIFTLAIKTESNLLWFFLPFPMLISFLCMQTPSAYINLILIFFALIYFFINFNLKNIIYFIFGSICILFFFTLLLFFFKIPFINFIQQYLLFPLSIAENRITGNEMAHITLEGRFTLRNVLGHFKFINFFLIVIILLTLLNYSKKLKGYLTKEEIIINLTLFFSGIAYIFHQLITSNQTFIFSLIPFLAGFSHIILRKYFSEKKILNLLIILLVLFSTAKYHGVYNMKRKFMDLQNVDLSNSIKGDFLDSKFKNLQWITPSFPFDPKKEINLLREIIKNLREDKRSKMIITEYQIFSIILEENLNIPNRWYTHDNNSYPLENHKYYKFYKKHFTDLITKNNIEVIYIIGFITGDSKIKNFQIYMEDTCFVKNEINELATSYKLENC